MILPTQKTQKNRNWIDQKFLMIGCGGIGKSEFWSHGERTLFLECEAGLNALEVFKVPVRCWEDFLEAGSALLKAKRGEKGSMREGEWGFPYDTIVIDTVDKWVDYANEEVITRGREKFKTQDINTIGDIPNGAGWFWATQLVGNYLGKLQDLPAAIVLIGHLQTKEIKTSTQSYHRETISIGGKTGESIIHWSDHTLFVEAQRAQDGIRRTIRTKPTTTREGKSRGGIVPDMWKWEEDSEANYKFLRGLFV